MTNIILLFVSNAVAHIFSFLKLNQTKSTDRFGVLVFVFLNAIIACLLYLNISWIKWLALIVPIIGGMGLLLTTIIKGKGSLIDYIILILDILIIYFVLTKFFL